MSKRHVTGSMWIEYSEVVDGVLVRKTIKADNMPLVLHQLSSYEDRGNGRNGEPVNSLEVTVPGFETDL